ncbi:MAG TPA: kelch repeat-containing protein [Candidatus Acidoferrum sp.]|nr:kelch repeat-containing protein [Candidatus Acidoferrum sp.]
MDARRRPTRLLGAAALILGVLAMPHGSRPQDAPAAGPSPVAMHSATWLSHGRLLIAGGVGPGGPSDALQIIGASSAALAHVFAMPRMSHSATLLPDGTVLMAGGQTANGVAASLETVDGTGRTTPLPMPLARAVSEHATVLVPDGRALVLGGRDGAGAIVSTVQAVDVTGGHVAELLDLGVARAGHTATLLADGRVLVTGGVGAAGALSTVEFWDPARSVSAPSATSLSTPRSGHAATLLPSGDVLLVGGAGPDGKPLATLETFDATTGDVRPSAVGLSTPRSRHSATLLPTGEVLIWGGIGPVGTPLASAELIDPRTSVVRILGASLSNALTVDRIAPALVWSRPASGATDVATTTPIALGFSEPLAVTTITASATLEGPAGRVEARVVPTADGLVGWVTPAQPLASATTYTLTLSGLMDTAGNPLPRTALTFTTAGSATTSLASATGRPGTSKPIESENDDPLVWTGEWRQGRPYSRWQSLPPLQAPPGVTAIAGQVLRLDGEPLPDVTLRVDDKSTRTDPTGRFLLSGVAPGPQVLLIDGGSANTGTTTFGTFEVSVPVTDRITNVLPYTSWMPRIDTAHVVSITAPTVGDVIVSNPRLRGLEIHIPPDTVVRDRDGHVVTQLSLTPIPTDRPPFPVPVDFPVYFTVQPNGAHLETHRGPFNGARVTYPNTRGHRPDTEAHFWSYEPEGGVGWYRYGTGRVTPDAASIKPDPGVRIYKVTMHSFLPNTEPLPPPGPPPGNPNGVDGEPVDLSTGLFVMNKVDLAVADVIPMIVRRAYRTGDLASRAFGIGMTHDYEMFVWSDQNQACPVFYLVLPDGGRLTYTRQSGTTCLNSQYVHAASPTRFHQSQLFCQFTTVYFCRITLRDGRIYEFDGHGGVLLSVKDRFGNALTLTRIASVSTHRVLAMTSPKGRTLTFVYDGSDRVTQIQDDLGRVTSYQYDASGRLWRATDPAGGVTEYTYEDTTNHRMKTIKDPRGIVYLTNEYDALSGRVTRQTLADPTATYQFAYTTDSGGHVTQTEVTDPRGMLRRVTFNLNGYTATDTRAVGQPEAQTTTFGWDTTKNLVSSTTDALGRLTTYTYDTKGNLLTLTRLADRPADLITTTMQYEPAYSRVTSVVPSQRTTDGQVSIAYTGLTQATVTDARGKSTAITYNTAGQVRTVTDPLSQMTEFVYDASGNLTDLYDPLRNRTTRAYDPVGRLVSQTDPRSRTTSFVYDGLNQLVALGDATAGVTRFSYDGNGNLLSVTDARGNATTYHYDAMDRLDQRTDPLTHAETYHYDKNGNVDQFTDRKGQTTTFTYDGLNRRTATTSPGITTTYGWDAGNRLTQAVDSVGGTVTNAFDDLDRLTGQTTALGTVSYPGYDSLGRRLQMQVPGQTLVAYQWDPASRLTQITQGTAQVTFGYDDANRRTSLTLPNGVVTTYGYDVASRVASLIYTNGTGELGRLTYAYDAAGNRAKTGGSFARTLLPPAVASATYDSANRQMGFGDKTLGYDLNGNLTNITEPAGQTVLTWDARDRLNALSTPTPMNAAFVYDGFGRRGARTVNGGTTQFLYDGADIVQEAVGAGTTNYLRGLGIDEAFVRNGTEYYIADAVGSTIELTNGAGTVATEYSYEPFGRTTSTLGTSSNSIDYTGREDDGLGLKYYRARYYHPQVQRFISEDPLQFGGGDANLYAYVRNAPTTYIDPLGLDIAVIESGPTEGNPIGHTAIAITGYGIFSRGNAVAPGSSLAAYLAREAPNRDTAVTVIRTSTDQDAAALLSLRNSFPRPVGKIWDNCASTSNEALSAAGIPNRIRGWIPIPYPGNVPGVGGLRASEAGGTVFVIPQGSTQTPISLFQFEPASRR